MAKKDGREKSRRAENLLKSAEVGGKVFNYSREKIEEFARKIEQELFPAEKYISKAIKEIGIGKVRSREKIIISEISGVLSRYFTDEDIAAIQKFVATEAGKKLIKNLPSIDRRIREIADAHTKKVIQEIYEELKKIKKEE